MSLIEPTLRPMTWDEVHRARPWGTCPEPAVERFAKRRLKAPERVLDVGCGVGAQSAWLGSAGFRVYGIDVSPAAILAADDRKTAREALVDYRVADVTEGLAYQDEYFDAAVEVCCLQHIVEPGRLAKAFGEIRRVLKPGGWMLSVLASGRHDHEAFGGMAAKVYSRAHAAALFRGHGFLVADIYSKEYTFSGHGKELLAAHWIIESRKIDA